MQITCYLCSSKNIVKKEGEVRDKKDLNILECMCCGLVFLDSSSHILENHYQNSGMHGAKPPEIDAWQNEVFADDLRRFKMLSTRVTDKSILDVGCGAGGFLNMIRKKAMLAEGVELEKRVHDYWKDELKLYSNIEEIDRKYDFITLFHVLEHIADPVSFLKALRMLLNPEGRVIIEVPNSDDALLTIYDSSAFKKFNYWTQHLYVFNVNTLQKLAIISGFKKPLVQQIQRYPLSNHLYWLSKGLPGGHIKWQSIFNNRSLDEHYSSVLGKNGACDTIFAELELELDYV